MKFIIEKYFYFEYQGSIVKSKFNHARYDKIYCSKKAIEKEMCKNKFGDHTWSHYNKKFNGHGFWFDVKEILC